MHLSQSDSPASRLCSRQKFQNNSMIQVAVLSNSYNFENMKIDMSMDGKMDYLDYLAMQHAYTILYLHLTVEYWHCVYWCHFIHCGGVLMIIF